MERTLIKDHHNIAAQLPLTSMDFSGSRKTGLPSTGDWNFTLLADLAHIPQTKHLEAAGIGQNRPLLGKVMQVAMALTTSVPGRNIR